MRCFPNYDESGASLLASIELIGKACGNINFKGDSIKSCAPFAIYQDECKLIGGKSF
jgi:hypothetical protein